MFYHLPLSIPWNPVRFCDHLLDQDVVAAIVGSEIHITFSSANCEKWRDRFSDQIARLNRALPGVVQPHGCIQYFQKRFLRNLELRLQPLMVPSNEPQLLTVQASLRDIGAILLSDTQTEFDIAYRHCSEHVAIGQYRQEIERLSKLKQKCIDEMDFENAAYARDLEFEARANLDRLLVQAPAPDADRTE